jgi:hypothetical protein
VTAVAVWSTEPTPQALLDERRARGWRPLPSPLLAGPEVLGFAAKVPKEHWAT